MLWTTITALRSEIPSGMCAKLRTVATIEIMIAISLTIACSRYVFNGVILRAYPVRGESHDQRNTTGKVATTDYHIQMRLAKTQRKQHLFEKQNNTKTKIWAKWGPSLYI